MAVRAGEAAGKAGREPTLDMDVPTLRSMLHMGVD
jgi:hypothetical protein